MGAPAHTGTPSLIIILLTAENAEIRRKAAETLAVIPPYSNEAIHALITALDDDSKVVRITAVKALGKMGRAAQKAVPSLKSVFSKSGYDRDEREELQKAAIVALGKIGEPTEEIAPFLIEKFLNPKESIRWKAAMALKAVGADVVPYLIDAMHSTDQKVRFYAAMALGEIGSDAKEAVDTLTEAMTDSYVTAISASALGKIGPDAEAATPVLIDALSHDNFLIRNAAAEALGKIGPAAEEENAGVIFDITDTFDGEHAEGIWEGLTDEQLEYLFREEVYVNIHTPDNPSGEIRGQVRGLGFAIASPDKTFTMDLAPGLNMISLPLRPPEPYSARTFADEIGATTVITLDAARQKFVGFTPDTDGDGFPIEGGEGYIVNVPDGGTVTFFGRAWANAPGVPVVDIRTTA